MKAVNAKTVGCLHPVVRRGFRTLVFILSLTLTGAGMHQTLTLDSTQQGPDRFFGT